MKDKWQVKNRGKCNLFTCFHIKERKSRIIFTFAYVCIKKFWKDPLKTKKKLFKAGVEYWVHGG